jgi:hypothetical protein
LLLLLLLLLLLAEAAAAAAVWLVSALVCGVVYLWSVMSRTRTLFPWLETVQRKQKNVCCDYLFGLTHAMTHSIPYHATPCQTRHHSIPLSKFLVNV